MPEVRFRSETVFLGPRISPTLRYCAWCSSASACLGVPLTASCWRRDFLLLASSWTKGRTGFYRLAMSSRAGGSIFRLFNFSIVSLKNLGFVDFIAHLHRGSRAKLTLFITNKKSRRVLLSTQIFWYLKILASPKNGTVFGRCHGPLAYTCGRRCLNLFFLEFFAIVTTPGTGVLIYAFCYLSFFLQNKDLE